MHILSVVNELDPTGPLFFFLIIRRTPSSTLFPYTTLFRSLLGRVRQAGLDFWIGKPGPGRPGRDRKSTRLNSSHVEISYAVFCLKKKMIGKRSAKRMTKKGGATPKEGRRKALDTLAGWSGA